MKTAIRALSCLLAGIALSFGEGALGAPGDVDTTFGTGGVARASFAPAVSEGWVLATQSDGKAVVAAGLSDSSIYRVGLARFHTDGTPDTTFGAGGRIVHELPPGLGVTTIPSALLPLAGGKLLLVGFSNANGGPLLARFNPDGTLDASYGASGTVTISAGSGLSVADAVLQADGKVLVAGSGYPPGSPTREALVARYNADGTLDATFGNYSPGLTRLNVGTGDDSATTLEVQPDGRIVVGGHSSIDGNTRMVAWRLEPAGTVDSSFGCASAPCSGSVTLPLLSFLTLTSGVAVLGDGKIVLGGFDYFLGMMAARLNANGTLDTAFGCNPACLGYTLAPSPGYQMVGDAMAVLGDGRIVLAGHGAAGSDKRAAIALLSPAGVLDTSISPNGVKFFSLGTSDQFSAAALQADGKLLLSGSRTLLASDAMVVRLGADFAADATYGSAGLASASFPVPAAAEGIAVQPDGRVVATGQANAANLDFGVARWNADGTPDTSFGCVPAPCEGKTTVPILTRSDASRAVVIQPDGGIVLAGRASDTSLLPTALARLDAAGSLDSSFGCGTPPCSGTATFDYPGSTSSSANALARQPDGKILVAGVSRPGAYDDFGIARLMANGTLDANFGCATPGACSGRTQIDMAGFLDAAWAIAVLPDGKILVAGEAGGVSNSVVDFAVIRLHANGTLDTTFGDVGRAFVDFGSTFPSPLYDDAAYAMHVQPDGAIVLAGRSRLTPSGTNRFVAARLLANGTLDSGFGTGGRVIVGFAGDALARAVVGLADGRLLIAGHAVNGAKRDVAVVALTSTGALDATFGAAGIRLFAAGAFDDFAYSAALSADEQLYVGARSNDLMSVVRFDTKGRASLALASDNNPSLAGQPVTLTATLSGGAGYTGTVSFNEGATPIAGCAAVAVTGTSAACTTSALAAGLHSVVARYSGDAQLHASASSTLSQNVGAVHDLTVTKVGDATGSVTSVPAGIDCGATCTMTAAAGTVFTLTATPGTNAVFGGWSGGGCTGTGTCVVTLDAATTVTATFTLQPFELSVSRAGNGTGTVSSSPAGISCGPTCSSSYDAGTVVTLTATPSTDSTFGGWTVACSGTASCEVTMDAAKLVVATFTLKQFALTVAKDGNGAGTVTSVPAGIDCGADCSETYSFGTSVTLSPAPSAGSTFTGWSGACTGTGACVVSIEATASVTATFTLQQFALTVAKDGNGGGTVTSAPAGIDCGADCGETFDFGTSVTLSPVASPGSLFSGWSGACTGSGPCVVQMDAAKSVTATFTLQQFTLTVATSGAGSGSVTSAPAGIDCGSDCTESYDIGTSVTLTATPAAGSTFAGWSGSCVGAGGCTVNMNAIRSVTATFAVQQFALTASRSGGGSGTITSTPAGIDCGASCAASFASGTSVTLSATPGAGSLFAGWGGACSGTGACNVTMTAASSVSAAFELDPAADADNDGIPNGVEPAEGRNPLEKDNDVFGNARLFAMQQYRDFLGREGDPAGITGWTDLVTGGTYSRLQVIDSFLRSDEFAGFVAPVARLYFATFLRVPDFSGMTFNAGLVRNGTITVTQLADFFTVSPEFAATYGSLDDAQFVTLLYNNVLGRDPDAGGLAGWVGLLQSGYTRGQVLRGFSDSVEYEAAMANEVFTTMMYAGMLRRTPEASGFSGWVQFLDAATFTREQVINGFFLSTEYHGRFLP